MVASLLIARCLIEFGERGRWRYLAAGLAVLTALVVTVLPLGLAQPETPHGAWLLFEAVLQIAGVLSLTAIISFFVFIAAARSR